MDLRTLTVAAVMMTASVGLLASSACDSPGGTSGVAVFDTSGAGGRGDIAGEDAAAVDDASAAADSSAVEPDSAETPDVVNTTDTSTPPQDTSTPPQDTSTPPQDTGEPSQDTGAGATCAVANCPAAVEGPAGVSIALLDPSLEAPALQGLVGSSPAPSGIFELLSVDIYQHGTFSVPLNIQITDNYDPASGSGSDGTVNFAGEMWTIFLALDLSLTGDAFGQPIDQSTAQDVSVGGCWDIAGHTINSDLSMCATSWPEGADVPQSADFEYDVATGTFTMELSLPKEFIVSLLPPDYAGLGAMLITGPLVLVAEFAAEAQ